MWRTINCRQNNGDFIMDYQHIHSQTVYHGRVFDLRQEQVRLPNGSVTTLDIVAHPGAVVLVPLDEEGSIWFVRQYRYAAGGRLLEVPAGTLEPGEDPESCALRELREETGMSAETIQKIGGFYPVPGYSTEYLHIYLATGLTPDPLPGDEDEDITVERIPAQEAYALAESGQFNDAKTIAALLLARPFILG
jgi:ADP-ribose pyrophosphatase